MIDISKHERGAALIIVLGLVAVISGWAATAAYEDMLSMRRAENALVSNKAELACLSALALAKVTLKQDARDGKTDNLDEDWAQTSVPFPIDDGLVTAEIIDANRYLNLNDLVDKNGKAVLAMVNVGKRLFKAKALDEGLVDALVDWIDIDDIPLGPNGLEDSAYFTKPYHVKNAPLDRIKELSLIEGFDKAVVNILQDSVIVSALPSDMYSKININTVQKDVLLAMFPNMTDVDADNVINNRPYEKINSLQNAVWAMGAENKSMFSRLSVVSNHFMVQTHAIFGRADWQEAYGLFRQGEKLTLLWRERLLWSP